MPIAKCGCQRVHERYLERSRNLSADAAPRHKSDLWTLREYRPADVSFRRESTAADARCELRMCADVGRVFEHHGGATIGLSRPGQSILESFVQKVIEERIQLGTLL
jgi:hypothetical protein